MPTFGTLSGIGRALKSARPRKRGAARGGSRAVKPKPGQTVYKRPSRAVPVGKAGWQKVVKQRTGGTVKAYGQATRKTAKPGQKRQRTKGVRGKSQRPRRRLRKATARNFQRFM